MSGPVRINRPGVSFPFTLFSPLSHLSITHIQKRTLFSLFGFCYICFNFISNRIYHSINYELSQYTYECVYEFLFIVFCILLFLNDLYFAVVRLRTNYHQRGRLVTRFCFLYNCNSIYLFSVLFTGIFGTTGYCVD